jgi:hypothetical protein
VVVWLERMEQPKVQGGFASAASLRDALTALLRHELGVTYLPWMAANAIAVAEDAAGVSVDVAGATYAQKPQRYAAKAFEDLRRKRAAIDDVALDALLADSGCDGYFAAISAGDDELDGDGDGDGADSGE